MARREAFIHIIRHLKIFEDFGWKIFLFNSREGGTCLVSARIFYPYREMLKCDLPKEFFLE